MIHDLHDLPAILASAPCSLLNWAHFAGAAVLALAVVGLEIWLRVPVRPVLNQLLAFGKTAPADIV
jgi:hypothetical protein